MVDTHLSREWNDAVETLERIRFEQLSRQTFTPAEDAELFQAENRIMHLQLAFFRQREGQLEQALAAVQAQNTELLTERRTAKGCGECKKRKV